MSIAASGAAVAQTNWKGTINNNWTEPGNWSAGVPSNSIQTRIDQPSTNPAVLGVSGAVSTTIRDIYIGSIGSAGLAGSLIIQSGSSLTNTGLIALGENAGANSVATVTGAGSSWTANSTFLVGDLGTGTLDIENGGAVTAKGIMILGQRSGSTGNINVSGGTLTTSNFAIGSAGSSSGYLMIESGGTVTSNNTAYIGIGLNPKATGDVTVTGAGSLWAIGFDLRVGDFGNGTLTIDDGAKVTVANNMTIADQGSSTSRMTIQNGGSLTTKYIGIGAKDTSNGTLEVNSGGILASTSGRLGDTSGASGVATVSGAGSQWNVSGNLTVGYGGTGTLTIQDSGMVTAQGGTIIANGASSTGTLNIGAAPGAPAVAPGTLNTPTVSFGAGTGAINFNHTSSAYTFAPPISGDGSVNVLAGTTIFDTDNTYTGPTTISGGTLLVNGSIQSLTTVEAPGTLGGNGTIFNDVTNFGTVAPGASIGVLTIDGNYIGMGGTLAIETVLEGDNSPTDQLIIAGAGHTASGTTGIVVTNVGGKGALTTGVGIPIVLPQGGATIPGGTFQLAAPAAAGPFEYLLFQGTWNGAGTVDQEQTYYLRNTIEIIGPDGEPEIIPIYRPDVSIHSVLASMARHQGLTTLGTFHDRNGDQRLAGGAGPRTAAWGRLFGQHMEQSHSGHVSAHMDGNTGGLQAGLDAMQWVSPSGHQDRFGLFAAYARTTGDVRGFALGETNRMAGRAGLDGTSFGAYWTHLAPTGWYTDTVLMGTRFNGEGRTVAGTSLESTGYGVTASVEGGYPIALWGGLRLEPQAQLVYTHINIDDVNDPYSYVAYETPDALSGRLGFRLSADMLPLPYVLRPYLKANIWQDFTRVDSIYFEGVHEIETRHRATTLELGGGVVAQLSQSVGFWVNGDYTTDIGGDHREAVRGTAGLRVTW